MLVSDRTRITHKRFWGATRLEAHRRAEAWLGTQRQPFGTSYTNGRWTDRGYLLTVEQAHYGEPRFPPCEPSRFVETPTLDRTGWAKLPLREDS